MFMKIALNRFYKPRQYGFNITEESIGVGSGGVGLLCLCVVEKLDQ